MANDVSSFGTESDLIDAGEFDIQPRLLKKKAAKEINYWVEYDKFTRSLVEITMSKKEKIPFRNAIFKSNDAELISKILSGEIHIGSVVVQIDKEQNTKKLIVQKRKVQQENEFDYVFASLYDDVKGPLHIECDVVFKKIILTVDYVKLKQFLSDEDASEIDLGKSNAHMSIFCVVKDDPTQLLDKIDINIFELCNNAVIERRCFWLPDQTADIEKFAFIYYNTAIPITYSAIAMSDVNQSDHEEYVVENIKPQIVYKQEGDTLRLQSIMENANNYKINEQITMYFFDENDPAHLYGYERIYRSKLNNFNLVEVKLETNKKVKVVTDHFHIHVEDSDVSTDYRI